VGGENKSKVLRFEMIFSSAEWAGRSDLAAAELFGKILAGLGHEIV
jgi:hypothetical protein